MDEEIDGTTYKVVVNHEEQYSIWPSDRESPLGWREEGKRGSKDECLAHIEVVWTDMRPLSLRRQMEEDAKNPPPPVEPDPLDDEPEDFLVSTLCSGTHRVVAGVRPEGSVDAFRACIERGYVHVRFVDTRGGTELGVELDAEIKRAALAATATPGGMVHIEGELVLDFVPVRCIADISSSTLEGTGRLERTSAPRVDATS